MHNKSDVLATFFCFFIAIILVGCGGSSSPSKPDNTPPILPPVVSTPPRLDSAFEDIHTQAGQVFFVSLLGHFNDEDNLVISVTESGNENLPSWLGLDPLQRRLFGIPDELYSGSNQISVTATNAQGLSTSTLFTINVDPVINKLTAQQLAEDELFIDSLLQQEFNFVQMGVGVNTTTALTHDGTRINSETLNPIGEPSRFSAASKESLHLNLLAKTLTNDPRAQVLIAGIDNANAQSIALNMLERKITSYEQFDSSYPAFGGFLPWFVSEDRGSGVNVYPLSGWEDRLPALDNGQLAWSIFLVYKSLYKIGHNELADRYQQRFQKMATNAKTMFFDSTRNVIAGISQFVDLNGNPDASLQPSQLRYIKDSYGLTDPFEGELMVMFMMLFSDDLSSSEKQAIWANKFINTRNYTTMTGQSLTVIEGWAFSSHEQWKYLVLPYLDYMPARDLFLNGEKVRADFSNQNKFRGFFASVNTPSLTYVSLLGIQSVASENGVSNEVIAPYATFPMLLADQLTYSNSGLNWLRNVLAYDKMRGAYGMTESYDTNTFAIAPLLTWDGKVLTDLAMTGGVYRETRNFMIEEGVYLPFLALIEDQYNKINVSVEGTDLVIANPLISPVPMDPCADSELISGLITDFDCQQTMLLPGITIVSNPNPSAQNSSQSVGQYTDPSGPWDALVIDFNRPIDLSSHNIISLKVLAPVAGILKVKLEGGNSADIERDIVVSELNSWVEYRFNFADQSTADHQKIAVFFNAGQTNQGQDIYYVDDIALINGSDTN